MFQLRLAAALEVLDASVGCEPRGNKNVDNPSFRVVLLVLFNLVLQYQPTCCTTKLGAYVPSAALTGPL